MVASKLFSFCELPPSSFQHLSETPPSLKASQSPHRKTAFSSSDLNLPRTSSSTCNPVTVYSYRGSSKNLTDNRANHIQPDASTKYSMLKTETMTTPVSKAEAERGG